MGIYVQLYNFEPDEKTKKPDGTMEYEIVKNGSNEKVFDYSEDVNTLPGGSFAGDGGEAAAAEESCAGQYTLKMKVMDKKRNQTLTPSATFTVT